MRAALGTAAVLVLVLPAACRRPHPGPASRTWTAMYTFATLTLGEADSDRLDACAGAMRDTLRALERKLSSFDAASDVSRLNDNAGSPVPVSAATRDVLALSRTYSEVSAGAFDITVPPLMALWGFRGGQRPAALPAAEAVAAALALVDWQAVELTAGGARLARPGMRVDLGGIAKGYAVDVCFDALRARGAQDVLVNLGGNLRCAGRPEPGRAWRVGVRDPFDPDGLLGTLALDGERALATSGNYERFVEIEGVRYAHIMDPRTGRPVSGMAGVTVLSSSAAEADAVSTALFVAGLEGAAGILARLPDCEVLLVPDRQPAELWVTPGFRSRFTPDGPCGSRMRDLGR